MFGLLITLKWKNNLNVSICFRKAPTHNRNYSWNLRLISGWVQFTLYADNDDNAKDLYLTFSLFSLYVNVEAVKHDVPIELCFKYLVTDFFHKVWLFYCFFEIGTFSNGGYYWQGKLSIYITIIYLLKRLFHT